MQALAHESRELQEKLHQKQAQLEKAEEFILVQEEKLNSLEEVKEKFKYHQQNIESFTGKLSLMESAFSEVEPRKLTEDVGRLREHVVNLEKEFEEKVDEEKHKVYESFIREYPEKREFLYEEREGSHLEDINERLLQIEREKGKMFSQLQQLEHMRELEVKLGSAEALIQELEAKL